MTTLLSSPLTPAESTSTRWNSATLLALKPAEWLTGLDTVLLTPGRHTIGSDADCTVVLNSAGVRPQHCLIVVGPKRTALKAWDAFTWLNEAPVNESELKPGDRIAIGPVEFIVRRSTADELIDLKLESPADHSTTRTVLQEPRQDQSAEAVDFNSSSGQPNDQPLDSVILPQSQADQTMVDSSVIETEGGQIPCVELDAGTTERLRKQTEETSRQEAELEAQFQDLRIAYCRTGTAASTDECCHKQGCERIITNGSRCYGRS
jgi:pSer/pThr/pTyr-binding forkhead associated (FHA) protein